MKQMNLETIVPKLTEEKLPGEKAQRSMMHPLREMPSQEEIRARCPRRSAVLFLLWEDSGKLYFALTLRRKYDGVHGGQVSLPGGKMESCDAGLEQTALRETAEELGIDPQNITIVRALTPLYIPVSNHCVHPFVGIWHGTPPVFVPDSREVERIIISEADSLPDPACASCSEMKVQGQTIAVPCFLLGGEKVWGATAMILAEVRDFLE